MQEEHELEMKAEELFNMTFGPLTWGTPMMKMRRRISWTAR